MISYCLRHLHLDAKTLEDLQLCSCSHKKKKINSTFSLVTCTYYIHTIFTSYWTDVLMFFQLLISEGMWCPLSMLSEEFTYKSVWISREEWGWKNEDSGRMLRKEIKFTGWGFSILLWFSSLFCFFSFPLVVMLKIYEKMNGASVPYFALQVNCTFH